jgi:hypothetical protein
LCEYGDALRRAGHGEEAQAALAGAAARARVAGEVALFARAAFGAHRITTLTESPRSEVIALLEEALTALDADATADDATADGGTARWLLSASLARELADGPHRDLPRAVGLASAAVEGARAAGDPGVLAYALFALADVRWAPGTAAERLSIAGELAAAAAAAHETELVLEAHLCRLSALLELGDPSFTVELGTFAGLAEQAAIPRYLYLARSRQATAASLTGPLETADELITAAGRLRRADRRAGHVGGAVEPAGRPGVRPPRLDPAERAGRGARAAVMPPEFGLHMRAWLLLEAGDQAAAAALVASIPDWPTTYRWRHTAMMTSDARAGRGGGRPPPVRHAVRAAAADGGRVRRGRRGGVHHRPGRAAAGHARGGDGTMGRRRSSPPGRGPAVRSARRGPVRRPGPGRAGPRPGGAERSVA